MYYNYQYTGNIGAIMETGHEQLDELEQQLKDCLDSISQQVTEIQNKMRELPAETTSELYQDVKSQLDSLYINLMVQIDDVSVFDKYMGQFNENYQAAQLALGNIQKSDLPQSVTDEPSAGPKSQDNRSRAQSAIEIGLEKLQKSGTTIKQSIDRLSKKIDDLDSRLSDKMSNVAKGAEPMLDKIKDSTASFKQTLANFGDKLGKALDKVRKLSLPDVFNKARQAVDEKLSAPTKKEMERDCIIPRDITPGKK